MSRPDHLPDFEAPPLTEVALSVQFEQVAGFGIVDVGLLWERFRKELPNVEYRPPLAPAFETFGLRQGATPSFSIGFTDVPPVPRSWFVSSAGDELVQVQSDRFVQNWRKTTADGHYPRYEHIRDQFANALEKLQSFLSDRGFGALVINQCDVTYVNTITLPDGQSDAAAKVFTNWNSAYGPYLKEVEDITFVARFVIRGDDDQPIGRLIAHSMPGLDAEGRPAIHLNLTGRGAPSSSDAISALLFMDRARDAIVCGFTELTTPDMHRVWKRRE